MPLLMALFAYSCHAGPKTYDEHLARLKQTVPQKALESEDEWLVKYGDFSGDGKEEMLAFVYEVTGRDEGMEWGQYYLCYSTQNDIAICDTLAGGFYKSPEMLQIGGFPAIIGTVVKFRHYESIGRLSR